MKTTEITLLGRSFKIASAARNGGTISEGGGYDIALFPSLSADAEISLRNSSEQLSVTGLLSLAHYLISLHGLPLDSLEIENCGRAYTVEFIGGIYKTRVKLCKQKITREELFASGCTLPFYAFSDTAVFKTDSILDFDIVSLSQSLLLSYEKQFSEVFAYSLTDGGIELLAKVFRGAADVISSLPKILTAVLSDSGIRDRKQMKIFYRGFSFFTEIHGAAIDFLVPRELFSCDIAASPLD